MDNIIAEMRRKISQEGTSIPGWIHLMTSHGFGLPTVRRIPTREIWCTGNSEQEQRIGGKWLSLAKRDSIRQSKTLEGVSVLAAHYTGENGCITTCFLVKELKVSDLITRLASILLRV